MIFLEIEFLYKMLIVYFMKIYEVEEHKGQRLKEGAYFKGPLKHKRGPINAIGGDAKRRNDHNFCSSSSSFLLPFSVLFSHNPLLLPRRLSIMIIASSIFPPSISLSLLFLCITPVLSFFGFHSLYLKFSFFHSFFSSSSYFRGDALSLLLPSLTSRFLSPSHSFSLLPSLSFSLFLMPSPPSPLFSYFSLTLSSSLS